MTDQPMPLDAVRARIDTVDEALLRLLDERAGLAAAVAAAKQAAAKQAGGGDGPVPFGLKPARETQVIRRLLALPRTAASTGLIVSLWRQVMGESLAAQGPFSITAFAGRDPARIAALARMRFGAAPTLSLVDKPEAALAAARRLGGVALLPLEVASAPWGRLLAEPDLRCFAVLPCLAAWGPPAALAVAAVEVEPSGFDQTLWVTDASAPPDRIIEHLGHAGLAAEMVLEAGGLKLFTLAGYVQPHDERLSGAPGRLSGVIGAAALPFDL